MIKAYKEKTIGVVDDSKGIRDGITWLLENEGYRVEKYSTFSQVDDWNKCDFWVLDNDTGERTKGVDVMMSIPNAVLFSGDYGQRVDDLKEKGKALDKLETERLKIHVNKFFGKENKLVIRQSYHLNELIEMGLKYKFSASRCKMFEYKDEKLLFEQDGERLIFIGRTSDTSKD